MQTTALRQNATDHKLDARKEGLSDQERLALLVEYSPDGLMACKIELNERGMVTDLTVKLANRTIKTLLGMQETDSLRDLSLRQIFKDVTHSHWRQITWAAERKINARVDIPYIRDGEPVSLRLALAVRPQGVIMAISDVTDLKRQAVELQYAVELTETQAQQLVTVATEAEQARAMLAEEVARREELEAELRRQSLTDPLTGINNRRSFDEKYANQFATARRYDHPLIFVGADIDKFKLVNDTYGHGIGDEVIKAMARIMYEEMRTDIDIVARYGGEEFVMLLPHTDLEGARIAVERVRARIERTPVIVDGHTIRFTTSFGVAQMKPEDTLESLAHRADDMLYRAKKTGRNRICTDGDADAHLPLEAA